MPTAMERVFNIPELLEKVLQHLSLQQLFIIQRVNRAFKRTISSSPSLRRAMFLEQEPGAARTPVITNLNPLLHDGNSLKDNTITIKVSRLFLLAGNMSFSVYPSKNETFVQHSPTTTPSWSRTRLSAKDHHGSIFTAYVGLGPPDPACIRFYMSGDEKLGEVADVVEYYWGRRESMKQSATRKRGDSRVERCGRRDV